MKAQSNSVQRSLTMIDSMTFRRGVKTTSIITRFNQSANWHQTRVSPQEEMPYEEDRVKAEWNNHISISISWNVDIS